MALGLEWENSFVHENREYFSAFCLCHRDENREFSSSEVENEKVIIIFPLHEPWKCSFLTPLPHKTTFATHRNIEKIQTTTNVVVVQKKIPPDSFFMRRLLVINFSPPNLINFPSKLMKTRIIQRAKREILPSVQIFFSISLGKKIASDESFNLSHTLEAHTWRHSPPLFPLNAPEVKKERVELKGWKTKFIFNVVTDGRKTFYRGIGSKKHLQHLSLIALSCVLLSRSVLMDKEVVKDLKCSWKWFFFRVNFELDLAQVIHKIFCGSWFVDWCPRPPYIILLQ